MNENSKSPRYPWNKKYCSNCGKESETSAIYCENCGNKIGSTENIDSSTFTSSKKKSVRLIIANILGLIFLVIGIYNGFLLSTTKLGLPIFILNFFSYAVLSPLIFLSFIYFCYLVFDLATKRKTNIKWWYILPFIISFLLFIISYALFLNHKDDNLNNVATSANSLETITPTIIISTISSTTTPPIPTPIPTWHTVFTFTGNNGDTNTDVFNIKGNKFKVSYNVKEQGNEFNYVDFSILPGVYQMGARNTFSANGNTNNTNIYNPFNEGEHHGPLTLHFSIHSFYSQYSLEVQDYY